MQNLGRRRRRFLIDLRTSGPLWGGLCRYTVPVHVALKIEQGKPFSDLKEFRMLDVLAASHQPSCNVFFGHGLAKLVTQQDGECGRAATQIPLLDRDALLAHLEQRADRTACIGRIRLTGSAGTQSSNATRTMVPLTSHFSRSVIAHQISLGCRDIARLCRVPDQLLQRTWSNGDEDEKVNFGLSSTLIRMRLSAPQCG